MFNTNIFGSENARNKEKLISEIRKAEYIFVADLFLEDYTGGAELTT